MMECHPGSVPRSFITGRPGSLGILLPEWTSHSHGGEVREGKRESRYGCAGEGNVEDREEGGGAAKA